MALKSLPREFNDLLIELEIDSGSAHSQKAWLTRDAIKEKPHYEGNGLSDTGNLLRKVIIPYHKGVPVATPTLFYTKS